MIPEKFNYFWASYKNLEDKVLEVANYIQFDDKQSTVYSNYIADLLVMTVMQIESLSKELYRQMNINDDKELKFDEDCIKFLDDIWEICKKEIFISSNKIYFDEIKIAPLKNANKKGKNTWKCAYQAVKHDRKKEITKGNIKNLIFAMGALYILNLYYKYDCESYMEEKEFDHRLNSEIFAATVSDITTNTNFLDDESILNSLKCSLFVLKFKDSIWSEIENDIKNTDNIIREDLLKNDEFKEYIKHHDIHNESLTELAYKFLGKEYLFTNTSNIVKKVISGKKVVMINKNKPVVIYGKDN
ncbi:MULTISPECIES: hypothetical protein [unclassified Campylobacter]|uniref:hypothetical protein n=1 Tax=unclassified Campylobacter TaxID=2593542 RepID=UPI0022E9EA42|nr:MULTISPECIES: hypothetical protein [unclassified Campylobacter]MDA3080244.1 hypothetical protein [Campylobacter sp. CS_NA2]MDA3081890.1 hypothetical protein [Campylobacter sp. CS_NA1]MDA3086301.1 hypothetical protein [Campylobacter sp. CS_ED1]MDA3089573.1 hypothetical protein [Campylobacter sp. CS_ED2]WBR51855.1 hypothetical protein PF026_03160 [Campylobacter sp. CS_NA3]